MPIPVSSRRVPPYRCQQLQITLSSRPDLTVLQPHNEHGHRASFVSPPTYRTDKIKYFVVYMWNFLHRF